MQLSPMTKLALLAFFLLCIMSCAPLKLEKEPAVSPCHSTMKHFFQCNFENWQPLSSCILSEVDAYFPNWEKIPSRNGSAGNKNTANIIKVFSRKDDETPKEVWYTVDVFTKIVVEYPGVKNPKKLVKSLGVPDLKLDYYLDVLLYEKKEWVYLDEGLSLRLDEKNEVLWEIQLFVPTNKEYYMSEIYQAK